MNRKHAITAVLSTAAVLRIATPAGAQTRPLRIALIPTEIAAGAYYANDLGYFKDAGLDAQLTSLQNGSAITAAVISGAMDVGFSNTFSLIVAHDKGLPVSILSGTDVHRAADPTNGILSVPQASPIHTARDLAGKTLGTSSLSNTTYYALRNWIDRNGGDSKLSKYVEIPIPQMADALIAGRVDAAPLDAANANADRSRKELRRIASTYDSIAPRFMAGAWFAASGWAQNNPDLVTRFVESMHKASVWANAHATDSAKIYSKYSRFSLSDLLLAPRPLFATTTTADLIQPVIDVAAKYGAIKAAFPAHDMLSPYAG